VFGGDDDLPFGVRTRELDPTFRRDVFAFEVFPVGPVHLFAERWVWVTVGDHYEDVGFGKYISIS